jgi:hypothetical protein
MDTLNTQPLPTMPELIKATAIALAAAAVILITTVLPAEYGIDPTGIGKTLGLTALSVTSAQAAEMPASASTVPSVVPAAPTGTVGEQTAMATVSKTVMPYRSDELSLTLQPNEGAEIKAIMRKGAQFVFKWATDGGKVNFDMHGEPPDAGDKFTSYWKGQQQANAQGTFVAPFDGTHGWYWRNRGDKAVTIQVKVSGFHEKLYKPS